MEALSTRPKNNESQQKVTVMSVFVGAAALMLTAGTWWGVSAMRSPVASRQFNVSQKGQEFHPSNLVIGVGDVVRIVNDDGDLSHHAYVASPKFAFDSGDQEPGHDVLVPFTQAGTFNVLCGIHPKMRLVVTVK